MNKYYKVIAATVASVSTVYIVTRQKENKLNASWTTGYEPSLKWNSNWDHRDPSALTKPKSRNFSSNQLQESNENTVKKTLDDSEINKHSTKATRHLFLIRHGQYEVNAREADKMILTELGNEQTDLTGRRLSELTKKFKFTKLTNSSMIRAIQSANNIVRHLPEDLPRFEDPLLCEGAPIPPEPPVGHWKPELFQFYEDGSRIEAAFRKYFHRASPEQLDDSFEIVVCHANVIRYFFCRALQFPPEAWLRFGLDHGSITHIYIRPDGRVGCRTLGESGFIPIEKISS